MPTPISRERKFYKGVWKLERAFQFSCKEKAEISDGGLNDSEFRRQWGGGG